jgi:hypothetical protein
MNQIDAPNLHVTDILFVCVLYQPTALMCLNHAFEWQLIVVEFDRIFARNIRLTKSNYSAIILLRALQICGRHVNLYGDM